MEDEDLENLRFVYLDEENSTNPQDTKKIKKFFPLINKLAKIFAVKIIVDVPNGVFSRNNFNLKEESIFLHFNSYPAKLKKRARRRPKAIFGQTLSLESPSLEEVTPNDGLTIISPENHTIGWIRGRDICIYPGVLEGATELENTKILSQILYWSLPYAVNRRANNAYFAECYEKYRKLRQVMTNKMREGKNKTAVTVEFRKFLMRSLQKKLTKGTREFEEYRAKTAIKKIEYFEALTKLVELEERLENLKIISEASNFALEFEKIMAMELIETVRIFEGKDANKIIINTTKLFQFPDISMNRFYDIGKFEIHINMAAMDRNGVHFLQKRYRGSHQHFHAKEGPTCFGTAFDAGLNTDIDKLMMDFDITPLIHVVITFLVKESSAPSIRERGGDSYPEDPPLTYESPEDRQKEKDAFIKVCREESFARRAKSLEPAIAATRKTIESSEKDRLSFSIAAKESELNIQYLEGMIADVENLSLSEVHTLMESGHVFGIEVQGDEIHICFTSPESSEQSYEKMMGYTLRLKHNHPPELIFPADGSFPQNRSTMHRMQLMPNSLKDIVTAKDATTIDLLEKEMARYQIDGNVNDLFNLVNKLITKGICDSIKPKEKLLEGLSGWM